MKKKIGRIGETNRANNGLIMTIITYRSKDDIDIQFNDGTIVYYKTYSNFKVGKIRHPTLKCTKYPTVKGTLFNINIECISLILQPNPDELGVAHYTYNCPKCNERTIATIDEIRKHKCVQEVLVNNSNSKNNE